MSLTRANVEAILVARCAALLQESSLDYQTVDGTNSDLNDPIGWAIRQLGGTVDSAVLVDDDDVATVDSDDTDALFDLAEYRTLETCHGALLALVDLTVGPRSESFSDMAARLEAKLERLWQRLVKEHGLGLGSITGGVWDLDFVEKDE